MGITISSLSNKTLEAVIPACKKGRETYICNNVNATSWPLRFKICLIFDSKITININTCNIINVTKILK